MKVVDYMTNRKFNPIVEILLFAFFYITIIASTIYYKKADTVLLITCFVGFILLICYYVHIYLISKPYLVIWYYNDKCLITKNKNEIIDDIVNNNVFYDLYFNENIIYKCSFDLTEEEYKTMFKCEYKFNKFKYDYLQQLKQLKQQKQLK